MEISSADTAVSNGDVNIGLLEVFGLVLLPYHLTCYFEVSYVRAVHAFVLLTFRRVLVKAHPSFEGVVLCHDWKYDRAEIRKSLVPV